MDKAYSVLEIKGFDEERRELTGVATTPSTDRMEDVVVPKGAKFKLPIPLLWQHDKHAPVGHVVKAKVTDEGIEVVAKLAKVEEPGNLKDRIDEAWQSIKYGLVRGLSIGFRALETEPIEDSKYGIKINKWEWLELSPVTIPANEEASITTVKQFDSSPTATGQEGEGDGDLGDNPPGDSGTKTAEPDRAGAIKLPKGKKMDIAEQIAALEATFASNAARKKEIMSKAAEEGRSTDEAEREEFDNLDAENKTLSGDITRLKAIEEDEIAAAEPVPAAPTAPGAKAAPNVANVGPRGSNYIQVRSNAPVATTFAKFVIAMANAKGNHYHAAQIAEERWGKEVPMLPTMIKAAVAAGTTSDSTWAGPLVQYQDMTEEFIEFLRPKTILGRIDGLVRVPFNVRVPRQTSGGSASWVGEGKAKPLTKADFDSVTLDWFHVANVVALTKDVLRFSNPSIETLVRDTMAAAIIARTDIDFVDPGKAASAGVSPASITNGLTPVTATGTTADDVRADMNTLFAGFDTNNIDPENGVWIMRPSVARKLSSMRNAFGQKEFEGLTANGGNLDGYTVITSQHVPDNATSGAEGNRLIFMLPSEILLADEGQVTIDSSTDASLEMSDGPLNDATDGTGASLVSMFQTNSVALRAARYICWEKRRANAVSYIDSAAYA